MASYFLNCISRKLFTIKLKIETERESFVRIRNIAQEFFIWEWLFGIQQH